MQSYNEGTNKEENKKIKEGGTDRRKRKFYFLKDKNF